MGSTIIIIVLLILTVFIVILATIIALVSKNKATVETMKRKELERNYKLTKSSYIAKQRTLKCAIESRDNKIEAQAATILLLKTDCAKLKRELISMEERLKLQS